MIAGDVCINNLYRLTWLKHIKTHLFLMHRSYYLYALLILSDFIIITLSIDTISNNITKINNPWLLRKLRWNNLANTTYDPNRSSYIHSVFNKAVGVYDIFSENIHANQTKLKNTILTLVIESYDPTDTKEKYRHYLFNLICYLRHFRLKAVLYIISSDDILFDHNRKELESFYHGIYVLSYPYHRFWSIIAGKDSNTIWNGAGRGAYKGTLPSFRQFGALPMFIPMLEILDMGFNVIYFDLDIALLDDPIPYLLKGDANIVIAQEIRSCIFPSFLYNMNWMQIEPNTGTMFLESTPRIIQFFNDFLKRIVYGNWMNDQKHFFENEKDAIWTRSCDENFDHSIEMISNQQQQHQDYRNQNNYSSSSTMNNNSNAQYKYCFLSEFFFRNGYMDRECAQGRRNNVKESHYDLSLAAMSQPFKLRYNNNLDQLNEKTITNLVNHSYFPYPILLHVNYCSDKIKCLKDRRLWIYRQRTHHQSNFTNMNNTTYKRHSCAIYDLQKTIYASYNWTEKLLFAIQEFQSKLQLILNGSLVKLPYSGTAVFQYANHKLHNIYDLKTFNHMGYSFDNVVTLTDPYYMFIPFGDIIRST